MLQRPSELNIPQNEDSPNQFDYYNRPSEIARLSSGYPSILPSNSMTPSQYNEREATTPSLIPESSSNNPQHSASTNQFDLPIATGFQQKDNIHSTPQIPYSEQDGVAGTGNFSEYRSANAFDPLEFNEINSEISYVGPGVHNFVLVEYPDRLNDHFVTTTSDVVPTTSSAEQDLSRNSENDDGVFDENILAGQSNILGLTDDNGPSPNLSSNDFAVVPNLSTLSIHPTQPST